MTDLSGLPLVTRWLGRPHEHWTELASTNDRALAWARAGAPHGAMVTADAQTAGRGRLGRAWESPPGDDLYVSIVVRPGRGEGLGALGLAVGVGLREGLAHWLPRAQLKWPNDVLVDGRKLAGILCEARWLGAVPTVIVGFGINVGRMLFPPPIAASATSLALALAVAPPRSEVLSRVLAALELALTAFLDSGFSAIHEQYARHCALHGKIVEVATDGPGRPKLRARALGLADDGALLVSPLTGGPTQRVESGDVWLAPTE